MEFCYESWVRVSRGKMLPTEDSEERLGCLQGTWRKERGWGEHSGDDAHWTKIRKDPEARAENGLWSHGQTVKVVE